MTDEQWEKLRESNNRLVQARAKLQAEINETLAWIDQVEARLKA